MVESGLMYNEEIQEYMQKLREKSDAFFAAAGKAALEVYRIEKFEPVPQKSDYFGQFYDGDSYVVLKNRESKVYDIHYWHGKDATADEMGSAAALSVQLSEHLPLQSRHHLELMGEETQLFMSYFNVVKYLPGGIESGFRHVEPKYIEPKLMLIKGKRYPRVFTIPMEADQINEGDVFVLDMGDDLYYWAGTESNYYERLKALELTVGIRRDERMMKCKLHYPRDMGGEIEETFWNALGGRPAQIKPAVSDEPTADEETLLAYKFWHVSDASGTLETTEITDRPLKADMLKTDDSYILELYDTVYVWQGRNASTQEKRNAMAIGKKFVTDHEKPKGTHITRIPEGVEDSVFKAYFEDFHKPVKFRPEESSVHENQDVAADMNKQAMAAKLCLDKLGNLSSQQLYRLEDDLCNPVEVPDKASSFLYAEEVYVLDVKGSKHRYLLCWKGPKLNSEQVMKTQKAMDKLTGGEASTNITRIYVSMNHEDDTFMQFFKNRLTILRGSHRPYLDVVEEAKQNGHMYRITSPSQAGAKAMQQEGVSASQLNSGDTFLIATPGLTMAYLWKGAGSNEQEQEMGQTLLEQLGIEGSQALNEGEEPDEFWEALGGKCDYLSYKDLRIVPGFEPRLFSVSNALGVLFVKEVPAFTQNDLLCDDVYILDCYSTLYVWVGSRANKFEIKGARKSCEKYLASVNDGRDKDDVQLCDVDCGREPPAFTLQFPQWDAEVAASFLEDPLQKLLDANKGSAPEEKKSAGPGNEFAGFLDPETNKFPYDDLKGKFPEGVKPNKKEHYLSDEEFQSVLKMDKAAWGALKQWKQENKKKEVGLF